MRLWDKFLVVRRDGTVPDWPYMVMGGRDPMAPVALRAYAVAAEGLDMDPKYVADVKALAFEFEEYRRVHGPGDPDAGPHREDDPAIVSQIKAGSSIGGWRAYAKRLLEQDGAGE